MYTPVTVVKMRYTRLKTNEMYKAKRGRIGEEKSIRKGRATPVARTALTLSSAGVLESSYAERKSVRPVSFNGLSA